MKLKKGTNSDEVVKLLGNPLKTKEGKHPSNKRYYYQVGSNHYELLFLNDCLELCVKIKNSRI